MQEPATLLVGSERLQIVHVSNLVTDPLGPTLRPRANLVTLEALYDAHHRQVFGLVYRILSDYQDAEDVLQEVFLTAWRASGTYDPAADSIRTWLLTLARRRAIDVLRARRQSCGALGLFDAGDVADRFDVAPEASVNAERQEVVVMALADLPAPQREVIELAYYADLTQADIAARLNITVAKMRGYIRAALNRLAAGLGIAAEQLCEPATELRLAVGEVAVSKGHLRAD